MLRSWYKWDTKHTQNLTRSSLPNDINPNPVKVQKTVKTCCCWDKHLDVPSTENHQGRTPFTNLEMCTPVVTTLGKIHVSCCFESIDCSFTESLWAVIMGPFGITKSRMKGETSEPVRVLQSQYSRFPDEKSPIWKRLSVGLSCLKSLLAWPSCFLSSQYGWKWNITSSMSILIHVLYSISISVHLHAITP